MSASSCQFQSQKCWETGLLLQKNGAEGGQLLPRSVIRHLPGVLPGRCLVLPGYGFWICFSGPKISAFLKLKLWEEHQFPPRDVT